MAAVALLLGTVIVSGESAGAATTTITATCDALGYQWLAQTSPNVTKAYVTSPYGGSDGCTSMSVTQYVDLFGSVTPYQQSGSTTYVYAPNSSGAYGNAALNSNGACLVGPYNPCTLSISVLDDGNNEGKSAR